MNGLKKVVIHLYNKQFRMPTMCDEKIGVVGVQGDKARKEIRKV